MMMHSRLEKIKAAVEQKLSCSAHNLDHVYRVYRLSLLLAESEENVDMNILEPAVLLHDIARVEESEDITGVKDHAMLGSEIAANILKELDYTPDEIDSIRHCIETHRFRTGHEPKSIEAKILYDADKLDAIGAIGIARCFMLGGQHGQSLAHADTEKIINSNTAENGRIKDMSKHSPVIEYEVKLKRIPDKLFTKKAKEIGLARLEIMEIFFENLQLEIAGRK